MNTVDLASASFRPEDVEENDEPTPTQANFPLTPKQADFAGGGSSDQNGVSNPNANDGQQASQRSVLDNAEASLRQFTHEGGTRLRPQGDGSVDKPLTNAQRRLRSAQIGPTPSIGPGTTHFPNARISRRQERGGTDNSSSSSSRLNSDPGASRESLGAFGGQSQGSRFSLFPGDPTTRADRPESPVGWQAGVSSASGFRGQAQASSASGFRGQAQASSASGFGGQAEASSSKIKPSRTYLGGRLGGSSEDQQAHRLRSAVSNGNYNSAKNFATGDAIGRPSSKNNQNTLHKAAISPKTNAKMMSMLLDKMDSRQKNSALSARDSKNKTPIDHLAAKLNRANQTNAPNVDDLVKQAELLGFKNSES